MNIVSTLSCLPDFSTLQSTGLGEAQKKHEVICSTNPEIPDRYKELRKSYMQVSAVFKKAAENFYPRHYIDRNIRDSDIEIVLIKGANKSKGVLDGLLCAMAEESANDSRLAEDFKKYAAKHIAVHNCLNLANEVFIHRGYPADKKAAHDTPFSRHVARVAASIFPSPPETA